MFDIPIFLANIIRFLQHGHFLWATREEVFNDPSARDYVKNVLLCRNVLNSCEYYSNPVHNLNYKYFVHFAQTSDEKLTLVVRTKEDGQPLSQSSKTNNDSARERETYTVKFPRCSYQMQINRIKLYEYEEDVLLSGNNYRPILPGNFDAVCLDDYQMPYETIETIFHFLRQTNFCSQSGNFVNPHKEIHFCKYLPIQIGTLQLDDDGKNCLRQLWMPWLPFLPIASAPGRLDCSDFCCFSKPIGTTFSIEKKKFFECYDRLLNWRRESSNFYRMSLSETVSFVAGDCVANALNKVECSRDGLLFVGVETFRGAVFLRKWLLSMKDNEGNNIWISCESRAHQFFKHKCFNCISVFVLNVEGSAFVREIGRLFYPNNHMQPTIFIYTPAQNNQYDSSNLITDIYSIISTLHFVVAKNAVVVSDLFRSNADDQAAVRVFHFPFEFEHFFGLPYSEKRLELPFYDKENNSETEKEIWRNRLLGCHTGNKSNFLSRGEVAPLSQLSYNVVKSKFTVNMYFCLHNYPQLGTACPSCLVNLLEQYRS